MEKFSKRRDELFLKLGKVALRKYEDKEDSFKPKTLEAQYLNYQKQEEFNHLRKLKMLLIQFLI